MANSISSLLDSLQRIQDGNDSQLNEWCDKLCIFYEDNDRHSYSEITEYILSCDGGIEYMERIIPVLSDMQCTLQMNGNDVHKKVLKLIDHIQLEILRLRYINQLVSESVRNEFVVLNNEQIGDLQQLQNSTRSALASLESKSEEITASIVATQETQTAIQSSVDNLTQTAEDAKKKVQNAQNEIIAILGIFSSVVLAFVGGLTFSTSVLQNISNASIYKIIFISCGIALIMINIIYMLIRFVMEVKDAEIALRTYPSYLKKIDAFLVSIAIITVILWFIDIKHIANIFQNWVYHNHST